MLGKLLRLEFRATFRPFLILYGAVFLLMLLELFSFHIRQMVAGALFMLALALLSVVLLVLTIVLVARRFSNNLFSGEGYLMFALPVCPWKILLSKFIPALLWVSVSMILFLLGQFSALLAMDAQAIAEAGKAIDEAYAELGLPPLHVFFSLMPLMMLSYFISIVFFIALLYFSITLANTGTFQRHSGIWAVLLFLGMYIGYCALEIFISFLVPWGIQMDQNGWHMVAEGTAFGIGEPVIRMGLASFPVSLTAIVLLFWLTTRLMRHHLSLK